MRKKKWLSNDINKTKMKNRPYKVTRWNISVKGMRKMCVDFRLYKLFGCIFHVRQSAVLTIDTQWSCFCFDFLCVYRLSLYDSASRLLSLRLQETKIKTNSPWHKLRWRRLNNHCLCRFIVIVIKSCTLLFGWRCCFLLARSFFLAIDIIFSDGFFSVYVRVIRFLCDCFDFFSFYFSRFDARWIIFDCMPFSCCFFCVMFCFALILALTMRWVICSSCFMFHGILVGRVPNENPKASAFLLGLVYLFWPDFHFVLCLFWNWLFFFFLL